MTNRSLCPNSLSRKLGILDKRIKKVTGAVWRDDFVHDHFDYLNSNESGAAGRKSTTQNCGVGDWARSVVVLVGLSTLPDLPLFLILEDGSKIRGIVDCLSLLIIIIVHCSVSHCWEIKSALINGKYWFLEDAWLNTFKKGVFFLFSWTETRPMMQWSILPIRQSIYLSIHYTFSTWM